ncbi:MAG: hypothetical protein PHD70_10650 [Anaerostipes sp.]|nr:hypothetical protein [Anaerostipes sp.]
MAIVKKKASDKNLPFLSDQYMVADFHGEYNQATNKIAGEQLMKIMIKKLQITAIEL